MTTDLLSFVVLAALSLAGGIGVVTLRQPVHAALALVATLLTIAVFYVTLHAHFLAAIQVIVYAGAIMVLFLFVIMLLNVEGQPAARRLSWMRPAAFAAGLIAAGAIAVPVWLGRSALAPLELIEQELQGGSAERIGAVLFSDNLLAFHLVGVLLLTGILAAVSLVQREAAPIAQGAPTVRGPAGATAAPNGGSEGPAH